MIGSYSPKWSIRADRARFNRLNKLFQRSPTGLPIGLVFVRPDGAGGLYIEPAYVVDSTSDLERLIDLFGHPSWDDRTTTTLRRARIIPQRLLVSRETRPEGRPYPERFNHDTLFALRLKQTLIERWSDRPGAMLMMWF